MKFKFYALWLCLVCIFFFLMQLLSDGFTSALLLNKNSFYEPWRFLTAIFLHGSFSHILFNLFALALFGSILERLIGGKRFLTVFFVTGILANLFSVNFYENSLGASGAIFGIIGALIIIRPSQPVWAFGMPMPIFLAGILWAIADFIGLFVPSGTANLAHLSGLFFGLVIGAFYRNWNYKREKKFDIGDDLHGQWHDLYMR